MVHFVFFALMLIMESTARSPHPRSSAEIDFDYRIADTVKALYTGPFSKLRGKTAVKYPDSIAGRYVNESSQICGDAVLSAHGTSKALEKRQECFDNKVVALNEVLKQVCPPKPRAFVERDPAGGEDDECSTPPLLSGVDEDRTVAHLRLGDAFCATTIYSTTALRPPPAAEVAEVVSKHRLAGLPCTLVYSSHGGCLNETKAYLNEIVVLLHAQRTTAASAPLHLKPPSESEMFGGASSHSSGRTQPPPPPPFPSLARGPLSQRPSKKKSKEKEANKECLPTIEEGVGWGDADRHFCAMVNAKVFIQGSGGFSYLAERVRALRSQQEKAGAAGAAAAKGGGDNLVGDEARGNTRRCGAGSSSGRGVSEEPCSRSTTTGHFSTVSNLVRVPIYWLNATAAEADHLKKVEGHRSRGENPHPRPHSNHHRHRAESEVPGGARSAAKGEKEQQKTEG